MKGRGMKDKELEKRELDNKELDSVSGGFYIGGSIGGSYISNCITTAMVGILQTVWPGKHMVPLSDQQAIWNGLVCLASCKYGSENPALAGSYTQVLKAWGMNDEQITSGLASCMNAVTDMVNHYNKVWEWLGQNITVSQALNGVNFLISAQYK